MQAPTITIAQIRDRSRHPRIAGSGDAYGNWSDEIVEIISDATRGILDRYTENWDWSKLHALASWSAAFYLLFDHIAFRSERGNAFSMEVMGSHTQVYSSGGPLPDSVRGIVESFSINTTGFSTGRIVRSGRSRR